MKRMKILWLAIHMEWSYWRIVRMKKTIGELMDRGELLSSERMVALSEAVTGEGIRYFRLEKAYLQLLDG